ncbi:MAG: hypothetical protein JKY19_09945 [Alcanivoracaceae bacterium]|nr:hypothetical protein [Alcanivoracaceae bacterium]
MNQAEFDSKLDILYLNRLEALWNESRDEIKQRILQRDNYFIRLAITLGAILIGSLKYQSIMFLLPIITLYFTILMVHSYQIHQALAKYMRDELEVKIKSLLNSDGKNTYLEFEEMFYSVSLVGVRSWLSIWLPHVASIITILITSIVDVEMSGIILMIFSSLVCSIFWYYYTKNHNLIGKNKK